MAVQCTYSYQVNMSYVSSDNKEYPVVAQSIQYVYVLHDYDNNLTPWIFLMVRLDADIYNMMVKDQGKGRVNLTLSKYNKNATSSSYIDYIQDQFMFIMKENPNQTATFDNVVSGQGQAFKTCPIGLVKEELFQYNQKQFEGFYKNTTMSSLILDATSHMKILIEPLKFNTSIENLTVPNIGTVTQFIGYLNSKYNFYGDQYMFFIDFDKTYLKSSSGRYIDAKDGQYPFVAFDIREMTNYQVNEGGMVIDDDQTAYIIYVDPMYVDISTDRSTPQLSANVVVVDSSGKQSISTIDTSIIGEQPNKDSTKYVASDDPNAASYITNTLQNNSVNLVISKMELDASLITPNKEYLVSNYEGYEQYTGRYYLSFKQEIFYNTGVEFVATSNIGLKMVVHY